jgi:hypothetical protein
VVAEQADTVLDMQIRDQIPTVTVVVSVYTELAQAGQLTVIQGLGV